MPHRGRVGARVLTLDVVLELDGLDAPLTAAADLDAAKVAGAHQGIDLTARDVEDVGDVGEREETR